MTYLIDNYDSFTYNLVQYFGDVGQKCTVIRNDDMTVDELLERKPENIVISPGPAAPKQAGICIDLVRAAANHNIPLLGICLGHQAIGEAFGGKIVRAPRPVHGEVEAIKHSANGLFNNIENPAQFTRYHSLVIERETCPNELRITAEKDDLIMAVEHKDKPIYGVQFHPESIASTFGKKIISNFIALTKEAV